MACIKLPSRWTVSTKKNLNSWVLFLSLLFLGVPALTSGAKPEKKNDAGGLFSLFRNANSHAMMDDSATGTVTASSIRDNTDEPPACDQYLASALVKCQGDRERALDEASRATAVAQDAKLAGVEDHENYRKCRETISTLGGEGNDSATEIARLMNEVSSIQERMDILRGELDSARSDLREARTDADEAERRQRTASREAAEAERKLREEHGASIAVMRKGHKAELKEIEAQRTVATEKASMASEGAAVSLEKARLETKKAKDEGLAALRSAELQQTEVIKDLRSQHAEEMNALETRYEENIVAAEGEAKLVTEKHAKDIESLVEQHRHQLAVVGEENKTKLNEYTSLIESVENASAVQLQTHRVEMSQSEAKITKLSDALAKTQQLLEEETTTKELTEEQADNCVNELNTVREEEIDLRSEVGMLKGVLAGLKIQAEENRVCQQTLTLVNATIESSKKEIDTYKDNIVTHLNTISVRDASLASALTGLKQSKAIISEQRDTIAKGVEDLQSCRTESIQSTENYSKELNVAHSELADSRNTMTSCLTDYAAANATIDNYSDTISAQKVVIADHLDTISARDTSLVTQERSTAICLKEYEAANATILNKDNGILSLEKKLAENEDRRDQTEKGLGDKLISMTEKVKSVEEEKVVLQRRARDLKEEILSHSRRVEDLHSDVTSGSYCNITRMTSDLGFTMKSNRLRSVELAYKYGTIWNALAKEKVLKLSSYVSVRFEEHVTPVVQKHLTPVLEQYLMPFWNDVLIPQYENQAAPLYKKKVEPFLKEKVEPFLEDKMWPLVMQTPKQLKKLVAQLQDTVGEQKIATHTLLAMHVQRGSEKALEIGSTFNATAVDKGWTLPNLMAPLQYAEKEPDTILFYIYVGSIVTLAYFLRWTLFACSIFLLLLPLRLAFFLMKLPFRIIWFFCPLRFFFRPSKEVDIDALKPLKAPLKRTTKKKDNLRKEKKNTNGNSKVGRAVQVLQ